MKKVLASELKVGDVILPPARELRLWMRRRCAEMGLPETALHLTIKDVREVQPDKKGPWLLVTCDHTPEWRGDAKSLDFKFNVRPASTWPKIS